MNITKFEDAKGYEAALHSGCSALRLQGADISPIKAFWTGLSYFLPGGGADWDATPAEKVYVVIDGEITVETEETNVVLRAQDSVYLGPNERRRIVNTSNRPAAMIVVIAPSL
jgi:mannose-6-phosphate isomerase-like protein (cupin superfamily)